MRYILSFTMLLVLLVIVFSTSYGQMPLKGRDVTITGPQTFAMVVGISKYKYVRPLTYADKDAELFRDYLKSPGGGSIKDDNIFCLLNEQASNSNFWSKGFQWLKAKQLQKGDRLFIYLAGHGDAIDEDQFFFLGYDCNPAGDKNNYLVSGAIQLFNLKKKISNETTKGVEVFFIMDACRSNELPGGTEGQNFLNAAISEKRAGEILMLATGAGQESLEDASIGTGHGLFTYYLVDGLT
ncbi:MAG: caspase family protein, partial [Chitinophagaceae bacterium]